MAEVNWWRIEKMIFYTSWSQEVKEEVINRLIELEKDDSEFAEAELDMIMYDIEYCYQDPITHGSYYSQTDILKHLRKLK